MHYVSYWYLISQVVAASNIYWKLSERQSFETEITQIGNFERRIHFWLDGIKLHSLKYQSIKMNLGLHHIFIVKIGFKMVKIHSLYNTVMCGVHVDRDIEHTYWVGPAAHCNTRLVLDHSLLNQSTSHTIMQGLKIKWQPFLLQPFAQNNYEPSTTNILHVMS